MTDPKQNHVVLATDQDQISTITTYKGRYYAFYAKGSLFTGLDGEISKEQAIDECEGIREGLHGI